MSELQGFTVLAQLGNDAFDVSLLASSPERAISRVRGTMVHSRRDLRWMSAEYIVTEMVSMEEFKAGRAAGTR